MVAVGRSRSSALSRLPPRPDLHTSGFPLPSTECQVLGDRPLALYFRVVSDLHKLQRQAVRITEVDPAPASQWAVVDLVHVAVELHALLLELCLARPDVLDLETDVRRAQLVVRGRSRGHLRRVAVLEQLDRAGGPNPERHLPQF